MATRKGIEENIKYYTLEAQKASSMGLEATAKAYDRLIESNTKKLEEIAQQERADARKTADDESRCTGCGKSFNGARGLRSHQANKFNSGSCKA